MQQGVGAEYRTIGVGSDVRRMGREQMQRTEMVYVHGRRGRQRLRAFSNNLRPDRR